MLTGRRFGGSSPTSSPKIADAAGGRVLEPGDHPQRRGLAAPGRAEQREELAVGDVEVDVVDRDHRLGALAAPGEPLGDALERDGGGAVAGAGRRRRRSPRDAGRCDGDVGHGRPLGARRVRHAGHESKPIPTASSARSHGPRRPSRRSARAMARRVSVTPAHRSGSGGNGNGAVEVSRSCEQRRVGVEQPVAQHLAGEPRRGHPEPGVAERVDDPAAQRVAERHAVNRVVVAIGPPHQRSNGTSWSWGKVARKWRGEQVVGGPPVVVARADPVAEAVDRRRSRPTGCGRRRSAGSSGTGCRRRRRPARPFQPMRPSWSAVSGAVTST